MLGFALFPAMATGKALLTAITTPSRDQFRWTEWPKKETVTKLIVVLVLNQ